MAQKKPTGKVDPEALAKRRFVALIVMLTMILVLLLITGFLLLSMPRQGAEGGVFSVSAIHVNGNTKYREEEIVAASGVYEGQSIFSVNGNEAASKIKEFFPYYESVQVQTVNMSEVHITVTEVEPVGVTYANGRWIPIGANGKALEEWEITSDRPKRLVFIQGGILPEGGVQVGSAVMDEYSWSVVEEILAAVESTGFTQVTEIDIRDISDIQLVWRDQIRIRLGNATNLEHEIRIIADEVLPDLLELRGANVSGVLNAGSYSNEALEDQVVFTPSSLLPTSTTAPRAPSADETTAPTTEPTDINPEE